MASFSEPKGFIGGAFEFWSNEDAFSDAGDALLFGVSNPVTVAEAVYNSDIKGSVQKDIDDTGAIIETAAMAGTMYLVKGVVVVGALLIGFTALKAFAVKKATR